MTNGFVVNSGADPLVLSNLVAQGINLTSVGSIYIQSAKVTGLNEPLQIQTLPSASNQANIVISGTIEDDLGMISLVSAGSIYTSGTTDILAWGGRALVSTPAGGNQIYLIAGAKWTNNGQLVIQDRSGMGGDIILPGLRTLSVTTDVGGSEAPLMWSPFRIPHRG